MNKLISPVLSLAVAALLFTSCDSSSTSSETDQDTTSTEGAMMESASEVTLTEATDVADDDMEGMLQLTAPTSTEGIPAGNVDFSFEVKNYELGAQTPGADQLGIANSGQGQHIHFIMDNAPYSALYEPKHSTQLDAGYHVLLAFLSRSYHLSIKNPEAFVLQDMVVGDAQNVEKADLTAPHMFYSRPKGEYTGNDAQKVLLDFYIVNADLGQSGYKVRVSVNGEEVQTLTKWAPYYLEGMPMGENSIKLEFLDADGNLVDSPYNPVERTITLTGAAS
ncbi:hypothetical protein SAMN05421823_1075 [Catalinimonas alkaloidigena]|uniref:Phosphopeptide-binding protein n=1 Tax=Catalinimonas alkaloidigena TaxID=1075417 RepID=A0A1G9LDJ9_9BACT|nr:hypothetical protein [Catalinimonas alkaloidigena]SDL59605.1 hypothetical protein SAMN05421823_1075 [Catalinimonas alkaloidigena]